MVRFDFNFFVNCIFEIIFKVPYTLYLGCVSFALSIFIAIMLVALRGSKIAPVRGLAGLYISFFRSTPYITQLFIFYYGLPQIFFSLRSISAETAFIVSVALNTSAFNAEIIRGGLLSVDKGQKEAAISIGVSKFQTMKEIIVPQAFISIFPSLGNALVGTIKNTAVAFTIGVVEILSQAKIAAAIGYNFMEAYIAAGIVYWLLIVCVDLIQKQLEVRIYRFL